MKYPGNCTLVYLRHEEMPALVKSFSPALIKVHTYPCPRAPPASQVHRLCSSGFDHFKPFLLEYFMEEILRKASILTTMAASHVFFAVFKGACQDPSTASIKE